MVERLSRLSGLDAKSNVFSPTEVRIVVAPMLDLDTKEIVSEIFNVHRQYIDEGIIGYRPAVAYMDAVERGWILLALVDDEIVGFAHYRVRRDKMIRLYAIAIKDTFRRHGIGSMLLDGLEGIEGDKICTEVRVENEPSINFFTKRGYIPGEVIHKKNYSVIPFTLQPLESRWRYDVDLNEVVKVKKRMKLI